MPTTIPDRTPPAVTGTGWTRLPAGLLRPALIIAVMAALIAGVALAAPSQALAQDGGSTEPTEETTLQTHPLDDGTQQLPEVLRSQQPKVKSILLVSKKFAGPYGIGDAITLQVNFNEPVVANGKTCIPLKVGEQMREACQNRDKESQDLAAMLLTYVV